MQTEAFVILGVLLTFIGGLMWALPALTRPTLPLGVSVPASRLDEPVIRQAIRTYRVAIVIAWAVCVALIGILAATAPLGAEFVVLFVFIAAQLGAYIVARQKIVRAKHEGDWYAGVPVRIAASVTQTSEPAPVPVGWAVASGILIACTFAVTALLYPEFPERFPTHWGLDGQPDRWADKSVWTVFGPLLLGTVVVAGLFALSFLGRRIPIRPLPGVDAATNARRDSEMRRAMSSLIGRLMFLISAVFAWTSLAPRLVPERGVGLVGGLVVLLLIVAILVVFTVRWRGLMKGDAAVMVTERGVVDAPDDDRYWKAGVFYVNGDDPALWVQRRFGVGWTINLGHPAGAIIAAATLVLVVALIVFVIVQVGRT